MGLARGAVLAVVGVSCVGQASYAVQITDRGNPVAAIVLPDEPTETEQFAAEELQSYLGKISGARLHVEPEGRAGRGPRLLVGRTSSSREARQSLAEGDPDAFVIRTVGDDLMLIGASDRGTLYAVYDFLEDDLGCRWLGPGPDWEEVPAQATIEVTALNRTESPGMKYRATHTTALGELDTWQDYCVSWSFKQKINTGTGWPPVEAGEQITKRGGFRAKMRPHPLPCVLSQEDVDEHPEWLALRDGRRRARLRVPTQICTTNPEVVEVAAARLGEMFDARPELDLLPLSQGDSAQFCQCDTCLALDTGMTERWLGFVNAVARRLGETHPGKKLYTLAYHQTLPPPEPGTIEPEPNVMIQAVNSGHDWACFVHRFEREDCSCHVEFRKALEDWVAMTPGGVMVYGYISHNCFCMMPYPAPHKFVDDISYLHRIGVVGYQGQGARTLWGTYGITRYAVAKATWDPDLDPDALVKDYCDHAFREASEAMQRFYGTMEAGLEASACIPSGLWSYMTPEVMTEARKHLDVAHAAAHSEIVKKRLRTIEIGFHYGEMGIEAWRKAQKALADKDAALLREAISSAEAAKQYCVDEQEREPHYAAFAGQLTKHYARDWQRYLQMLELAAAEDAEGLWGYLRRHPFAEYERVLRFKQAADLLVGIPQAAMPLARSKRRAGDYWAVFLLARMQAPGIMDTIKRGVATEENVDVLADYFYALAVLGTQEAYAIITDHAENSEGARQTAAQRVLEEYPLPR